LQLFNFVRILASMAELTKTLKDAAYITIGVGVIAWQRAQVRRREVEQQLRAPRQQLESQVVEARDQLHKLAKDIEGRLEPVVEQFEERLPDPARELVVQARQVAKGARQQLTARIGGAAA
jgi:DNA anti-recombination protein RmuC